MNIRNLEYFLKLVQFEHVSATADYLNISQPSLSKHIRTLEKEVGVELFDRIGNRITLNKNGEQFAQYAGQAMDMLNAGLNSVKSTVYETKGTIRIAYSTHMPLLAPCIAEYSRMNPYITIDIFALNESASMSYSAQTDFVLNYSTSDSHFFDRGEMFWNPQPLFQESYVLIYGPETAKHIKKESFDLSDLKDKRFIAMSQDNLFFKDITVTLCLTAGFYPNIHYTTDDFLVKVKLLRSDLAVAFLPECCIQDALAIAPELSYVPIKTNLAKRTINLMRRKKVLMTEAAMDFWNFVLDYYGLPEDTRE